MGGELSMQDLAAEEVAQLAEEAGFKVVERLELPERGSRLLPVPVQLHPSLQEELRGAFPEGLYAHQAQAIAAILTGDDVVVATATASGKSLIYMAAATSLVLKDAGARVLALYPARALIQDQMAKWERFQRFGITIGYIDGGVPQADREAILSRNSIVLMTPDVAHAWLLRLAGSRVIDRFLAALRLVILDEAHVYEGAFGTNMAYFLRRLEMASGARYRYIVTSATLGNPKDFMHELSGRWVERCFTDAEDGSTAPPKTVLLAQPLAQPGGFAETVRLIGALGSQGATPFLAFADSRKQVEQLVAATRRMRVDKETAASDGHTKEVLPVEEDLGDLDEVDDEDADERVSYRRVMPYRAGYESEDRSRIQKALEKRELAGVVSTSALELGLDIGDINLVLLLTTPPSVKAFNQRMGRAGRLRPGTCLILDTAGSIAMQGLRNYLGRPNEPNRLYLDNRYIQYINVLCAARELEQRGAAFSSSQVDAFVTLPERFTSLLENELRPTGPVPDDLFPLKQRSAGGPHHEFPIRGGVEKQFQVKGLGPPGDDGLGTLGFSQVLREAYPGGIYYYLARPYRVRELRYDKGEIIARREKFWTTTPIRQSIVFPNFERGTLQCLLPPDRSGFVAESHVQVNERVSGFSEQRGSAKPKRFEYGPGSPYHQRPLSNFFETTGVSVCLAAGPRLQEEAMILLKDAFCREFGILDRDVGVGYFTANTSPLGLKANGMCVYDAVLGSLRLTQSLLQNFAAVARLTYELAISTEAASREVIETLMYMAEVGAKLEPLTGPLSPLPPDTDDEWVCVIAPGERVTLVAAAPQEVTVASYRYTPKGIMYDIEHPVLERWAVPAERVRPNYGQTRMLRVNLITGEEKPHGFFDQLPG
ncbi:MAG: DEAD/DEAH box helicase [Bacillota bacterium]